MSIKDELLSRLIQEDSELSISELALELGVNSEVVGEAMEQLRDEGYSIGATPGGTFCLLSGSEVLIESEIARWRTEGPIGARLEIHDELFSTNDRARELALAGAPHGTAVLARRQSGGRGRLGRTFFSPGGSGVYLSLVLRPKLPAQRAVLLTPMCAVAVARAAEYVTDGRIRADIKWVNDVCVNGRKICGILCESGLDPENGGMQYVVAGIGVNVGTMAFPEELQAIATSISNECGTPIGRSRFCVQLFNELNALWPRLSDGGFMAEYRARSNVIGHEVLVMRGGERYSAMAMDIDDEGSLLVRTHAGQISRLHSGEISIKLYHECHQP